MTPAYCPHCGAEVPAAARTCPECGSCEETGWSDRAAASSLGLPDPDFDYATYVREEFGGPRPKRRLAWLWWLTAFALIAVYLGFR